MIRGCRKENETRKGNKWKIKNFQVIRPKYIKLRSAEDDNMGLKISRF